MKSYIHKINSIIGNDRNKLKYFVIFFIFIAFLDILSIGLIGPFASIVVSQSFYDDLNSFLNNNFQLYLSKTQIITYISVLIILVFLIKSFLGFYFQNKIIVFSYDILHKIRKKIIKNFESIAFLNMRNKRVSKVIQIANNHTVIFTSQLLIPLLRILSESVILIFIIIFLAYTNLSAVLLISIIFFLVAFVFYFFVKNQIDKTANITSEVSGKVIEHIIDFLRAYIEIKIFNKIDTFYKRFDKSSRKFTNNAAKFTSIQLIPRYLFEISLILFVCIFILYNHILNTPSDRLIFDLSIFIAASIRILPSLNQITGNLNHLRYSKKFLEDIYQEFIQDIKSNEDIVKKNHENKKINTFESLKIENVSFAYNNINKLIENLNLNINKGDIIGIKGESGSGKTTLINLIIGFLTPSNGKILINDQELVSIKADWSEMISYIPQDFYLFNASIKENVTFFQEEALIDYPKLNKSLKDANIYKFIQNLENKENSLVGENGSLLSGGQKQRIAIARSLYFDKEIIIVDEATSSLDDENEEMIFKTLKNLSGKTKIVITHSNKFNDDFFDTLYQLK